MTVTWHVEDLKVYHMELLELQKFGQYLRDNFGDALMEHKGDIHDYLGIDLDFSGNGKLIVSVIKYLHKLLTVFLKYWTLSNSATSPAREHFFDIRNEKEAKYLPEEMSRELHHVVV